MLARDANEIPASGGTANPANLRHMPAMMMIATLAWWSEYAITAGLVCAPLTAHLCSCVGHLEDNA